MIFFTFIRKKSFLQASSTGLHRQSSTTIHLTLCDLVHLNLILFEKSGRRGRHNCVLCLTKLA